MVVLWAAGGSVSVTPARLRIAAVFQRFAAEAGLLCLSQLLSASRCSDRVPVCSLSRSRTGNGPRQRGENIYETQLSLTSVSLFYLKIEKTAKMSLL